MKKTRSKKSRDTVPLRYSRLVFRSTARRVWAAWCSPTAAWRRLRAGWRTWPPGAAPLTRLSWDDGGRGHPPLLPHRASGTWIAVLRIRNPGPFFLPLDPGWVENHDPDPGSGSGKQFFVFNCLNSLIQEPFFWRILSSLN
jgi:hypothetical protein